MIDALSTQSSGEEDFAITFALALIIVNDMPLERMERTKVLGLTISSILGPVYMQGGCPGYPGLPG